MKIVDFTLFGQRFQAMSAGPHHEFNDAVSMVVLCDDQPSWTVTGTRSSTEVASRKRAGGSSIGSVCGGRSSPQILDEMMRAEDPARSKRVTDAVLKMVKLDIATLEKAYRS